MIIWKSLFVDDMAYNRDVGTLSRDQFISDCETLVQKYEWIFVRKRNYNPFIKRTFYMKRKQRSDQPELVELHSDANEEHVFEKYHEHLRCDCHAIYSDSYCSPVLYFNMFTSNGKLISLQDIWDNYVHPSYKRHVNHDPWTFLTQSEHPILLMPYIQLHPCHTADFMKPVHEISQSGSFAFNYVHSWLSVVLPVISLEND